MSDADPRETQEQVQKVCRDSKEATEGDEEEWREIRMKG